MSANNYILIKWKKTRYEVTHRDADTNHIFDKIGKSGDLEEAVRMANSFIEKVQSEGSFIEYGLHIIPRPKIDRGTIQGQRRKPSNGHKAK